jgi:hypothetical protein
MSVLLEVSLRETEPIGTYPLERVHIERDCLAFWGRVLAAPGVVELEERDGATEFRFRVLLTAAQRRSKRPSAVCRQGPALK